MCYPLHRLFIVCSAASGAEFHSWQPSSAIQHSLLQPLLSWDKGKPCLHLESSILSTWWQKEDLAGEVIRDCSGKRRRRTKRKDKGKGRVRIRREGRWQVRAELWGREQGKCCCCTGRLKMLSLDMSRVSFKCVEQYVQTEFQHLHITKQPLLSIISTQGAKIDSAALPDTRAGVLFPLGERIPFLCYVCVCLLHVAEIMQDQM